MDGRGRTAPFGLRSLIRPEPPERLTGFGEPVLSPVDGPVIAAWVGAEDHAAHRGLPSVGYALTQGRRAAAGFRALAGNHVIVQAEGGAVVAQCHLRRGTLAVRPGDDVRAGQTLAECGNLGNSMQPHLHLQAMDSTDPRTAGPMRFTIQGSLPRNGVIWRP